MGFNSAFKGLISSVYEYVDRSGSNKLRCTNRRIYPIVHKDKMLLTTCMERNTHRYAYIRSA